MKKRLILLAIAMGIYNLALANTQPSDPILDQVAKHKTHAIHQHKKKSAHSNSTPKHKVISAKPKSANNIKSANSTTSLSQPRLNSFAGYAINALNNQVYVSKNVTAQLSIASITKLMTAMVVLDANKDLDEYIAISQADVDTLKNTFSRLRVGMELRRRDLLLLALMSSENRAASAIARTAYPGGMSEFIQKMNTKAKQLGMTNSHFYDPTGLTPQNKSTVIDLAKMVKAAYNYPLIRQYTTTKGADVMLTPNRPHHYLNSDALVRNDNLNIEVSKTGFINEAGHCLVLYAIVDNRPVVMAFLNSRGKGGRLIDAMAVKSYIDRLPDNQKLESSKAN
ncbi:MAG: hypothetical protein RLZZ293_546 [Pseudomonadota bacterium]|jgi:D-alanyl-D-alanine endopeptidase (penicillin-binding protein 7)